MREVLVVYWEGLHDLTGDELTRAVAEAIRVLNWFPKVAELRGLARPPAPPTPRRSPEDDFDLRNGQRDASPPEPDLLTSPRLLQAATQANRTPEEQVAWEADISATVREKLRQAVDRATAATAERRATAMQLRHRERLPRLVDTYERRAEADDLLTRIPALRASGQVQEPVLTEAELARERAMKSGQPFNLAARRRSR